MAITATIQAITPGTDAIQVTLVRSDGITENHNFDAVLDSDGLQQAVQDYINTIAEIPDFSGMVGTTISQTVVPQAELAQEAAISEQKSGLSLS